MTSSPSSTCRLSIHVHGGLELEHLVEATDIVTPPQSPPPPTTPRAPKKVRFSRSCTAANFHMSPHTFDICCRKKTVWLRSNHRANPKTKMAFAKPREAETRQAKKFHLLLNLNKHHLQHEEEGGGQSSCTEVEEH